MAVTIRRSANEVLVLGLRSASHWQARGPALQLHSAAGCLTYGLLLRCAGALQQCAAASF